MRKEVKIDQELNFFDKGYNCAESVLLAFAKYFQIESEHFPNIATTSGGGVSYQGYICGALLSAAMAVGLMDGRKEPEEDKLEGYGKTQLIFNAFKKEFGSVMCRDLIGVSLMEQIGLDTYDAENFHSEKCIHFVNFVINELIMMYDKK